MKNDLLVDVSSRNGTINWTQVRLAGVRGAVIRACVDDSIADAFWASNWREAKAQGLSRIAYLYAIPGVDSPKQQADHLLAILEGEIDDNDGLMLDLEQGDGDLVPFAVAVAEAWQRELPKNKRVLSSSAAFLKTRVNHADVADLFELAVADHGKTQTPPMPAAWGEWRIWHYATDRVPGISGSVGLSQCRGSVAEWLGGANRQRPPVNPSPIIGPRGGYVVAAEGDSTFSIAEDHNVSVDALESVNRQLKDGLPVSGEIVWLPGNLRVTRPSNAEVYIVRQGDSMNSIAKAYGRNLQDLLRANPQVRPPRLTLYSGEPVFIPPNPTSGNPHPTAGKPVPPRRTLRVQAGETPLSIAERVGIRLDELKEWNPTVARHQPLYPGRVLYIGA